MKNAGKRFEENFQEFDSEEELQFACWLYEAREHGLISDIIYHPETFELSSRVAVKYKKQLKTKSKIVERFLFHPHSFTPDFSFVVISELLYPYFVDTAFIGNTRIIVDVKGTFNKYGDPKQFSINQKWVMEKFGIYIEKIVPVKLFFKTWCPEAARYTPKTRQPVKKYIGVKTISEFIEEERN